VNFQFISRK